MRRLAYILLIVAALAVGWAVLKDHLDSSQLSVLGRRLSEMMVRKAFAKYGGYQVNLKHVVMALGWLVGLVVILLCSTKSKRRNAQRTRSDRVHGPACDRAEVFDKEDSPLSVWAERARESEESIGHGDDGISGREGHPGNHPGL